jgi:hypothetical protein
VRFSPKRRHPTVDLVRNINRECGRLTRAGEPAQRERSDVDESLSFWGGIMRIQWLLLGSLGLLACDGRAGQHADVQPPSTSRPATGGNDDAVAAPAATGKHALMASQIEQYFATEPRDAGWADGRELKLEQEISKVPGVTVTRVGCKSKICKIELQFEVPDGGWEFDRSLNIHNPGHELFVGSTATLFLPGPDNSAIWWMSRPGYTFSGPNQEPQPVAAPQ